MRVSVVIPTYNRADILRKTLEAYSRQSGDHQIIEVLVVDDGSPDHTASVVEEFSPPHSLPFAMRYLPQENSGPATARNYAIREAKGDLILLGDDDIVPARDMVAQHVAWHRENPEPEVGVLGYVDWARELNPTPFMVWSGLYGPQFNYGYFKRGMQLDFRYTYGCNTSLKLSFMQQHGVFDERFFRYGNEDVEFGFRLGQKGFRLLYNPDAVGYHYKYETFEDTVARIRKLKAGWPLFAKTEAGREFFRLRPIGKSPANDRGVKKILRPLKACAMPMVKPLCDTHIPLPGWLYSMVFYHYLGPDAPDFLKEQTRNEDGTFGQRHPDLQ
jgi:glycosyltransferase involved in cell wall biosynthesis